MKTCILRVIYTNNIVTFTCIQSFIPIGAKNVYIYIIIYNLHSFVAKFYGNNAFSLLHLKIYAYTNEPNRHILTENKYLYSSFV